jgi:ATP-binding cassette subfamily F protein 3
MIRITDLTLRRGPEPLLEHADLTIHPGDKIGLVGPNGCGKSTLFALLLGQLEADAGDLRVPREWIVAHMAQQIRELDRKALDYVLDGDTAYRAAESEVAEGPARCSTVWGSRPRSTTRPSASSPAAGGFD